jgi:ornithine cyclodeaminase/alanine dehydrogenase
VSDQKKLLFITEADTVALLDWRDVIACLAAAYAAPDEAAAVPPRVVARRDGGWLRVLTAMTAGPYMGAKIIARARTPQLSYLMPLWDRDTAELVCLLDAKHITGMRTAGTTAMAADRILPKKALRVAVLGSSHEAQAHAAAIASMREIAALTVYSPTPASREKFARRFAAELNIDCTASDDPRSAIDGADLILCAARALGERPILEGAWLKPGVMVASIGSTLPEQIEVDPEVIRRAEVIVADVPAEVMHETGDMLAAAKAGVAFADKVISLHDLVQGRRPAAQRADNIVLFKSVGSALQDIAVAELCFDRARSRGMGTVLPVGLTVKGRK